MHNRSQLPSTRMFDQDILFPGSSLPPSQRGQSLVEMGLLLMMLLWLLSGVINFGIGYFSYVAIRDAAQEGALYGSIDPTGDIATRVRNSSTAPVDMTTVTPTVIFDGTAQQTCPGHLLTVLVNYDVPVLMPVVGILTGTSIPIHASATSTILISPTSGCP
jgi:Flp pilus assembly protein TadG